MRINIKDYVAVRDYLGEDFDKVMDFILEARHYIYSFFENEELNIKISFDPEGGSSTIYCCIPYKFLDGDCLMEKFEETWFLDNMHRVNCMIVFDVVLEDDYEA